MTIVQESSRRGAAEAGEALRNIPAELASQMPRPAPRGRPPKGYIWSGGGYVHQESLAPYAREEHEKRMLDVWRQMRLLRYQEDVRGFRTKRVEALAMARIRNGCKPRRPKLKNATFARSAAWAENQGTDKLQHTHGEA